MSWRRDELLHLLSLSATLAGLCITGVTLFHTIGRNSMSETLADDMLATSALLFLVSTYTIFFALRTRNSAVQLMLERIADVLFLLALTGMVTSNYFAPGHRMRIEISSSNFPRFDRNLNTGGNN